MPGLPNVPAAEKVGVDAEGNITGLYGFIFLSLGKVVSQ